MFLTTSQMKNLIIFILITTIFISCKNKTEEKSTQIETVKDSVVVIPAKEILAEEIMVKEAKKNPADFLPEGYFIVEKIYGDLNNDRTEDCVMLIKKIDKSNIIKHEFRGELDRNRRGIIILFSKNGSYELAAKNYDCFSSENEEGGVYYAPELSPIIEKGKLYIHYSHGRYGYWSYTFRFQNSDFELIGYDESSHRGPIINNDLSINFLTKKKHERVNVNENTQESGEEVFKETWTKISIENFTKLEDIKDFDNLESSHLYSIQ